MRLLAVVDGTERTNRIINYVLAAARAAGTTQVVVLNVQEKREDARLRGYQSFKKEEIDNLMTERGRSVVTSVSQVLQSAGLAASCKVRIGRPVSAILRCAADEQCDVIVVGSAGPDTFPRFLRAVAPFVLSWAVPARIAALAAVPVVIVK